MAGVDPRLSALIEERLKAKGRVILAIDGPSGAGKSTLGGLLHQHYKDSALFHMDDFFLQPHQRTPERLVEPGGNVDRERFLSQVLRPLHKDNPFFYERFDCQTGSMTAVKAQPAALSIIEGVYSLHPALKVHYDVKVFLDIGHDAQLNRISQRVPEERYHRFIAEWIPMEKQYFQAFGVREGCDLILSGSEG